MKKAYLTLLISLFFFFPTAGDADYLLHFKNGGQVATPLYWVEGGQLYFFYIGGVVGIEQGEVSRLEQRTLEQGTEVNEASESRGKTATPPPPVPPVSGSGEEKASVADKALVEKINIPEQKRKKDQLTVKLNDLLEERREARGRKDTEAAQKITEEILNTSSEIYRMTDEVKEKNKGQLPQGWWEP